MDGRVSIQLLLLFYWLFDIRKIGNCCRFNTTFVTVLSILRLLSTVKSQVSIQLLLLFYINVSINAVYSAFVSIQLLLLFYYVVTSSSVTVPSFQYNFCYCSMNGQKRNMKNRLCFNTTFVTVLYFSLFPSVALVSCFNTTFVTVLSVGAFASLNHCSCFNTTFVTVLSPSYISAIFFIFVSIQLLLLFYRAFCRNMSNVFSVSIQLLLLFYLTLSL